MKRSRFRLFIAALVLILAAVIALPSIVIKVGDDNIRIRGFDPLDLNSAFVTQRFELQPSLDFQEGQVSVFDVNLAPIPRSQRLEYLTRIRNIVFTRIQRSGLSDFELDSLHNHDIDSYQLILHSATKIDSSLLALLTRTGELSAWVDDPNIDRNLATEEDLQDPFYGRNQTGISNEDIESATVISDSRIYLFDPSRPSNYGIRLNYREESAPMYVAAAQQSSNSTSPILYAIDNEPIAFQSPGQIYDFLNPGRTSLLVTLADDSYRVNAIIASVLSTPKLDFSVSLISSETVAPRYGSITLQILQVSGLVLLTLMIALLSFWYKKHARFIAVALISLSIINLALAKVFGLTLSLSMILGLLVGYFAFVLFLVNAIRYIQDKTANGITKEELQQVYSDSLGSIRNSSIIIIFLILVSQTYGIISVVHFGNGLGFTLVSAILTLMIIIRPLLPELYLRPSKKNEKN